MADGEVSQVQVWPVILAFFKEKGLVRQQLDSYDKFVTTTIAEVVGDAQTLDLRPQKNYAAGATETNVRTRDMGGGARRGGRAQSGVAGALRGVVWKGVLREAYDDGRRSARGAFPA